MITDIVIVSLGPGYPDLLNQKTLRAIRESETLILRTGRHPLSSWLKENDKSLFPRLIFFMRNPMTLIC